MSALEERGSLTDISYSRSLLSSLLSHPITQSLLQHFNPSGSAQNTVENTQNDVLKQLDVKPTVRHISTTNAVFIFISDIGSDLMTKLLLIYGNRSLLPRNILRNEVCADVC